MRTIFVTSCSQGAINDSTTSDNAERYKNFNGLF